MKNIIIIGLLLLTTFFSDAQKKELGIKHFGIKEENIYGLREMDLDKEGNKYVSGLFRNDLSIDTFHLHSSLGTGVFLAKYNANNQLVWIKTILESKPNGKIARISLKCEQSNNILLSLTYIDSIKIENNYYQHEGLNDFLIFKINKLGTILSTVKASTSCVEGLARNSIAIDGNNNYYFTGIFGSNGNNQNCPLTINGQSITDTNLSIFILKTDSNFNTIWLKRYGDKYPDYVSNIYVEDYTIYLAGSDTKNFESLIINYPTDFSRKEYLVALDTAGIPKWGRYYGMKGFSTIDTKAIYVKGKFIYFTGNSSDYQFFFQSSNWLGYSSVSGYNVLPQGDYFIACYDTAGNYRWAKASQSYGSEYITQLAVDSNNNLLAVGSFDYTMAMGTDTLNTYGGDDAFVTSLDSNGNYLWSTSAGGAGVEVGNGIATTTDGDIYVVGGTSSNTCYFGQDAVQVDSLPSMFLAKIVNATPVDLQNFSKEDFWEVFPNPASTMLEIRCPMVGKKEIQLYNAVGQMVINLKTEHQTSNIETSKLPEGIYFLQLKQQGNTSTKKLI